MGLFNWFEGIIHPGGILGDKIGSAQGTITNRMGALSADIASVQSQLADVNQHLQDIHTFQQPESNFVTFYAAPTNILASTTPRASWEWVHVRKIIVPGESTQIWVPRIFSGFSNLAEDYVLRLCEETKLATWTTSELYSVDELSIDPSIEWWTDIEIETFVQLTATTIFTITYTNEKGVSGRVATVTVPGGGNVGQYRTVNIPLQDSDLGVISIDNVVSGGSNTTGSFSVVGHKTAAASIILHSGGQGFTSLPPVQVQNLAFKPGRTIGFEYASNSTTTANIFAFVSGNLQDRY